MCPWGSNRQPADRRIFCSAVAPAILRLPAVSLGVDVTVIMISDVPGIGPEAIDGMEQAGLVDQLRAAAGFQGHWSGPIEGGYRVIELWDSPDAYRAWVDGTVKPNLPPGVEPSPPTVIELYKEVRPG